MIEQRFNLNDYNTVCIIGDVNSNYSNLQKIFETYSEDAAYIFLGNYFKKLDSKSAKSTFDLLVNLSKNNTIFLMGEREQKWLDPSYIETQTQLELEKLNKRLLPYFILHISSYTIFINHSGLLNERLFANDSNQDYDVDLEWNQSVSNNLINVHCNKNILKYAIHPFANTYNLTSEDELRFITLTKQNDSWINDNGLLNITEHILSHEDTATNLIYDLADQKYVNQRTLDDNIMVNNYTKEAFKTQHWDEVAVKAIGLFTRSDNIVGRGFNKFFEAGNRAESSIDTLIYPLRVTQKVDGFLAVVFYDKQYHMIRMYSKNGDEYYNHLAAYVLEYTGEFDKIDEYYSSIDNRNNSLLYEIIEPVMDRNIVYYDGIDAVRLAVIKNDVAGTILETGQVIKRLNSEAELKKFLVTHTVDNTSEGYVIHDAKDKIISIKTNFFRVASELKKGMDLHHPLDSWLSTEDEIKKLAYRWYIIVEKRNQHTFTPKLAYDLYNEFRTNGDSDLLPPAVKLDNLVYNGYN